jgi:Protein of unknown function (DUF1161)
MKPLLPGLLAFVCLGAAAQGKTCEDLTIEIADKLKAAGVQKFSLEVVPNALVGDAKVAGSCENGSKKIIYERGAAPPAPAARPASAPKPVARPASAARPASSAR